MLQQLEVSEMNFATLGLGKIKARIASFYVYMAPRVGFEPTTCGLTVRRSTD